MSNRDLPPLDERRLDPEGLKRLMDGTGSEMISEISVAELANAMHVPSQTIEAWLALPPTLEQKEWLYTWFSKDPMLGGILHDVGEVAFPRVAKQPKIHWIALDPDSTRTYTSIGEVGDLIRQVIKRLAGVNEPIEQALALRVLHVLLKGSLAEIEQMFVDTDRLDQIASRCERLVAGGSAGGLEETDDLVIMTDPADRKHMVKNTKLDLELVDVLAKLAHSIYRFTDIVKSLF